MGNSQKALATTINMVTIAYGTLWALIGGAGIIHICKPLSIGGLIIAFIILWCIAEVYCLIFFSFWRGLSPWSFVIALMVYFLATKVWRLHWLAALGLAVGGFAYHVPFLFAIGALLYTKDIWGWHWVTSLMFAAPGIILGVTAWDFIDAIMDSIRFRIRWERWLRSIITLRRIVKLVVSASHEDTTSFHDREEAVKAIQDLLHAHQQILRMHRFLEVIPKAYPGDRTSMRNIRNEIWEMSNSLWLLAQGIGVKAIDHHLKMLRLQGSPMAAIWKEIDSAAKHLFKSVTHLGVAFSIAYVMIRTVRETPAWAYRSSHFVREYQAASQWIASAEACLSAAKEALL